MLPQIRHDLVAVVIHPRFFAERVVAARNTNFAVRYLAAAKLLENIFSKIDREAEIVACIDIALRTFGQGGEPVHIGHRRDRQPIFAQLV